MAILTPNIQRQINSNSISDTNSFTLNNSTSTKIADARQGDTTNNNNPTRISMHISNAGNQEIWIKLQAASVDDLKEGILLRPRDVYWMDIDNIYTGEVSAIAVNGTPTVSVVEY